MTSRREPIRVLVVDADRVFVRLAKEWLSSEPALVFVGWAPDTEGALQAISITDPDVVLVGGILPGLEGLEVARRIKAIPGSPLVVLTSFSDTDSVRLEAWMAGADAFISKTDLAEKLPALLAVAERSANQPLPRARSVQSRIDKPDA
jgi:CheY-like chemotaxis protein